VNFGPVFGDKLHTIIQFPSLTTGGDRPAVRDGAVRDDH
jgi:hypothetical protein